MIRAIRRLSLLSLALAALALSPPAMADWRDAFKKAKDAVDVAKDATTATLGVGEEEELRIGKAAAATLLGAAPLVKDTSAQHYINLVGRWIASHSTRPELDWRFGILDSPNVGAFAAPGGFVLVTRGLLLELRDETELAGVLAHEIIHVANKHHLKALKKNAGMSLIKRFKGSSGDLEERIGASARTLYGRGLDRRDEYAADRDGAALARRAGYDPFGLMAVLQTLDSLSADDGRLALLLGTHPRPADRVAKLDKALESSTVPAGDSGARRYVVNLRDMGQ